MNDETGRQRILVVEDEAHIANAICICLERHGFQVSVASDGVSAVDKAFAEKPDLVLLDLRLPKMSGHLVLQAIREDERTSSIPVVVVSAASEESERDTALAEGADEYLVKPFTPKDLIDAVMRVLQAH